MLPETYNSQLNQYAVLDKFEFYKSFEVNLKNSKFSIFLTTSFRFSVYIVLYDSYTYVPNKP